MQIITDITQVVYMGEKQMLAQMQYTTGRLQEIMQSQEYINNGGFTPETEIADWICDKAIKMLDGHHLAWQEKMSTDSIVMLVEITELCYTIMERDAI